MVVSGSHNVPDVNNIMGGMEHTASGVRMHNHRRKLRQRFDLVRKLGQGTYGKVQLGINKETGQEVAIKTIKKAKIETEADLVRIRREIQIMSSVQHPNIIHIYEVFENKEKMVLVMEYAAGGELYDYLSERKVLSEDEARRIFRQVASAVYYCHKHKICHRDLKLENILLDESKSAKIADFGLSNVFDERRLLTTFCGSPLYASPEIVRGTPYHGPEVDCWSLGVLLYTLVYGAMPFDGSNFKRLVKQISSGDYYEPPKPSSASPLIRHMLLVDPIKRATVEDICSHWWVNETYGEACLEVAEELANQTPVRLDLLLSLLPSATNGDVVGGKLDTSISCVPIGQEAEGDSMNEYYSSNSNAASKVSEPTSTAAKEPAPKSTKKKREHDKEKEGAKRKRDETESAAAAAADDTSVASKKPETAPPEESLIESPSQSTADSRQQTATNDSWMSDQADKLSDIQPIPPPSLLLDGPIPPPPSIPPPPIPYSPEESTSDLVEKEEALAEAAIRPPVDAPAAAAPVAAAAEAPSAAEVNASAEDAMEVDEGVVIAANSQLRPAEADDVDAPVPKICQGAAAVDVAVVVGGDDHHSRPASPVAQLTGVPAETSDKCAVAAAVAETVPSLNVSGDKSLAVHVQEPTSQESSALTQAPDTAPIVAAASPDQRSLDTFDATKTPEARTPEPAPEVCCLPQSKSLGTLVTRQEESDAGPLSAPPVPAAAEPVELAQSPVPAAAEAVPVPVISQETKSSPVEGEAVDTADKDPDGLKDKDKDKKNRTVARKTLPQTAEQSTPSRSSAAFAAATAAAATDSVRHSKILRQAEIFNSLTAKSEPKNTMTLERPKKVTIYGFKQVSDARKVYEPKPETKPMIVPALKVSDAKKAFETAAAATKPTVPPTQSTLPRRTLIQTPPSSNSISERSTAKDKEPNRQNQSQRNHVSHEDNDKNIAAAPHPEEKVVVAGLGVKIGGGRVTEIGMQVKTEDSSTHVKSSNESAAEVEVAPADPIAPLAKAASPVADKKPPADNPPVLSEQKSAISAAPVIRSPELVNAAAAVIKASSPPKASEVKTKKPSPASKAIPAAATSVATADAAPIQQVIEKEEIEVVLDTGGPEPKVASMLVSGSTALSHRNSPATSSTCSQSPSVLVPTLPSANKSGPTAALAAEEVTPSPSQSQSLSPVKTIPVKPSKSPPPPQSGPPKIASPPPGKQFSPPPNRVTSPPPTAVKTAPPVPPKRLPSSPPPPAKQEATRADEADICLGSENAFLRSIRSPTREVQNATKRLSRVQTDGEITITLPSPGTPSPATPSPSGLVRNAQLQQPPPTEESALRLEKQKAQPVLKSEISIPVGNVSSVGNVPAAPRERIIPIQVEGRSSIPSSEDKKSATPSAKPVLAAQTLASAAPAAPARVTSPPPTGQPHTMTSQISRESVQSPVDVSDAQRLREPIRKSPREFIIPISVEGGGYVTPKEDTSASAGSRLPSLAGSAVNAATPMSKSGSKTKTGRLDRTKRYGGLFNDNMPPSDNNGDEANGGLSSPLHAQNHLQRHSSFGKGYGSDTKEDEPVTHEIRRNGSGSSCDDDDDDDDTFQILTAESLFSTLLSRVRQLTRRSNRDNADPFVAFRSPRYTSPAPSNASQPGSASRHGTEHRSPSESTETPDVGSPTCTSPIQPAVPANQRHSIGSDAASKSFWYAKSPPAAETDSRRYSTLDPSRHYGSQQREEQQLAAANTSSLGRHRSLSREPDGENISSSASRGGPNYANGSGDDSNLPYSTSSLTRRVLNQHLREMNPELSMQRVSRFLDDAASDVMSEASSNGGRSTLSRALARLNSAMESGTGSRKEYLRTYSSRELGSGSTENRRQQRYSRSSTSENIDAAAAGSNGTSRLGSPTAPSDEEITNYIPPTYRAFTRTSSREYMSPSSSRGTSPAPVQPVSAPPAAATPNPIVPQLSTVLEFGPQGTESESPRPVRAAEAKKAAVAVVTSTSNAVSANASALPTDADASEKKARRVSRFLRPDFYDTPRSESAYADNGDPKQRFIRSIEKRWEKYNGDEAAAPTKTKVSSDVAPVIVFVREIAPVKSPPPTDALPTAPRVTATEATSTKATPNGEMGPPVAVRVREIAPTAVPASPKVSPTKVAVSDSPNAKGVIREASKSTTPEASKVIVREIAAPGRTAHTSPPPVAAMTPAKQLQQARQNLEHATPVQHVVETSGVPGMRQNLHPVPQPKVQQLEQTQKPQQQLEPPQQQQPNLIPKPAAGPQAVERKAEMSPERAAEGTSNGASDQQQQATKAKTEAGANVNKNVPKLTVRRQFEHLLNLAAAQFQRSQSPNKVAPAPSSGAPLNKNSSTKGTENGIQSAQVQETKLAEDEMKYAADSTKMENACKSTAPRPCAPVKCDFLIPATQPAPATKPAAAIYSSGEMHLVPGSSCKYELATTGSSSTLVADVTAEPSYAENNSRTSVTTQLTTKAVREHAIVTSSSDYSSMSRFGDVRSSYSSHNGRAVSVDGDDDVRYARVKRLEALENSDFYYDEAPETPTDSYESSSVCSDLRDRDLRESGEDESVSERIFRKSFYTRFNEPVKKKASAHHHQQQQNRRSVSRDTISRDTVQGEAPSPSSSSSGVNSNLPPRLPSKSRRSSRDESAEAVMVRKFLSSRSDGGDSGTLERDRRYSSARRQQQQTSDMMDDDTQRRSAAENTTPDSFVSLRSSISRENSVARSVKSDAASPTSSVADSVASASTRDSRSYSRAYSSSRISESSSAMTSPSSDAFIGSSASLNRRSYYPSSNPDHISSLPRRTNRYSVHEAEMSHNSSSSSYSGGISRATPGRSSYKGTSVSRYSSIFEESGREPTILSPTSMRRNTGGLSDVPASSATLPSRRETTFYGTPSSRETGLNRREGSGPTTTYFLRSTSSGLDYTGSNGGSSSASSVAGSNYATLRPSYLRTHRR